MSKSQRIDNGIRRRGKSFEFRVSCGYRSDGSQIMKYRTFTPPNGTTAKKAEKLAKLAFADFKRECGNAYDLKDTMKFSELVEWYMTYYAKPNLKPQTWQGYQQKLNAYILPEFGVRKLKDFSPALLTEFYQSVSGIRKETLSEGSLKAIHKTLNSIFSCAVRQGFIEKNPCNNAMVPKSKNASTKRYYMTPEETQLFLNLTAEPTQENVIYQILLHTGMRVGECLALSWADVNFSTGFIHIKHNLIYSSGEWTISTPKTASSSRTIAISDPVRELFSAQRNLHTERVRVLGGQVQHPEMIFISVTGKYVSRNCLSNNFRKLVKGTPIEFMTIHMLRHSNASILINAGVDIKIVSEHLGHAEIGTTADIYADIFASTKQATATIVASALSRNKSQVNNGQIMGKSNIIPFKRAK